MTHAPTILHGNCLDLMATLPADSVDSIVTDPPYGLGFMGKAWDALPPGEDWARECLRVLKPGGHLLAFGGTRTWHRLAVAVEDAGFELRDSIAWLYGSGFPKSRDVSKAIDKEAGAEREVVGPNLTRHGGGVGVLHGGGIGAEVGVVTAPATPDAERWQGWGTALKPAFEPVVVGRKPLVGTVAGNVLEHGTGALNVDGCRVGNEERTYRARGMKNLVDQHAASDRPYVAGLPNRDEPETTATGRWPANVVLDESQAAALDQQSGYQRDGVSVNRNRDASEKPGGYDGGWHKATKDVTYGSGGGASRFFYCAKAPKRERPVVDGIAHPTVKPLTLMRWLVRLVTPPGGTVLEPFAGSGTTVEACILEGFHCIAIEREADYLPHIQVRIDRATDAMRVAEPAQPDQLDLFALN